MKTKRIVVLNPYIAGALKDEGHDIAQVTNALQSAANDVVGTEGGTKSSDVTKGKKEKRDIVKWTDKTTVDYVAVPSGPLQFLAWHDAMSNVFDKHGQPSGEVTIEIVPQSHKNWLDAIKLKRVAREAKGNGPQGPQRNAPVKAPAVPA